MTSANSRKHFEQLWKKNCNELANQTKPFHVCKFMLFVRSFALFRSQEKSACPRAKLCTKCNEIKYVLNFIMQVFVVLVFTSWLVLEMLRAFNAIVTKSLTATVTTTMLWLLVFYWLTKLILFHFIFWIFMLFAIFYRHIECMVHGAYNAMWIPNNLDPFISTATHFLFIKTNIKSRIYDSLTRFILYHSLFMTLLPAIHGFECSLFTVSYTFGWYKFNNIISVHCTCITVIGKSILQFSRNEKANFSIGPKNPIRILLSIQTGAVVESFIQ